MRVHFVIAALVLLATLVLRLDRVLRRRDRRPDRARPQPGVGQYCVEAIVDLLTVAHHPLGQDRQGCRRRRRLIAAIAAAVAGYLIFYQGILSGGSRRLRGGPGGPGQRRPDRAGRRRRSLTIFAKAWVGRGSPLQGGAVSGHAALAFAAATMLAFFYQKPLAALLAYFIAFLVAQSRVEARIHNSFEVLWGAVLGTIVALALYLLVRPHVVL